MKLAVGTILGIALLLPARIYGQTAAYNGFCQRIQLLLFMILLFCENIKIRYRHAWQAIRKIASCTVCGQSWRCSDMALSMRLWANSGYTGVHHPSRPKSKLWLWKERGGYSSKYDARIHTQLQNSSRVPDMGIYEKKMPIPQRPRLQELWGSRYQGLRKMVTQLFQFYSRYGMASRSPSNAGAQEQRWQLRSTQLLLGYSIRAKQKSKAICKKSALAFVLVSSPVIAQTAAWNGFCQLGGTFVSTVGMNSTTKVQSSYPKCTVTVYLTGTTNLATLFSNSVSKPLSNPFQANTDGSILFFASTTSCYDIVTSPSTSGGTPTMPSNFTYSNVCLGGGSGGGGGGGSGVGPGTVNQISKFTSTTNVGNSSGFDDGTSLVQWPNGLTAMGNAYGKLYPNSTNGTTANYLACIDTTVTTVAEVTTCPTSTAKAIGIVHSGTAGITGNAQITILGFDTCVFDNQTVVGDYVGPSTSVGGQCTDLGSTRPTSFQGVGRVTTLNTGAGTSAVIDLGPWDLFSPGSTGSGQCSFNNANAYFAGGSLACDQSVTDDGAGHVTAKSLGLTDPTQAGFYYLKQGTQPGATPANTRMDTVPASVTTYTVIHPGAACTVNQTEIVQSTTTDTNGNIVETMTCGATGGGSGTQALNPSAPTVTPKGTTGGTTYTYVVVGREDVNATKTSAASATGSTSTGNASLTTSNFNQLTGYADTLYGYRCYDMYRTVGGATQGKIASCVGKSFNDTGLAGDGTTAPNTNNTVFDQHCLGASLPVGVNVIPGAPCGVNAPPTSPTAFDDEFAWTLGAPGDANNPQYQQLNYGTSSTSLTNGELVFAPQNTAGNAIRMIGTTATMPSTPWEFELKFLPQLTNVSGTAGTQTGMCLYDGTKAIQFVMDSRYNTGVSVNYMTNLNTFSSTPLTNPGNATNTAITSYPGWLYFKIKDDGTSYTFSWSYDGVNFNTLGTGLVGAFLGAPTSIGPCMLAINAGSTVSIDFLRRTQ